MQFRKALVSGSDQLHTVLSALQAGRSSQPPTGGTWSCGMSCSQPMGAASQSCWLSQILQFSLGAPRGGGSCVGWDEWMPAAHSLAALSCALGGSHC